MIRKIPKNCLDEHEDESLENILYVISALIPRIIQDGIFGKIYRINSKLSKVFCKVVVH